MKLLVFALFSLLVAMTTGCTQQELTLKKDEMYFARCARFDHKEDAIFVIDPNSPRVITMDPWPQIVFLAADGEHTVGELIAQLGSEYDGGVPDGLAEQIHDIVDSLVTEGVIKLSDASKPLPSYLATPISKQDPDEAKKEMMKDGFIAPPK